MDVVASTGLLTVRELGRCRQICRALRQHIDVAAGFVVERQAWQIRQASVCSWAHLARLYGHWYCPHCEQLAPAGLWGQWRRSSYVVWCLPCHLAASAFDPPLHPPELPWGAVPHYSQQEPLHFLRRVLRAYQRHEREPAAHHDDADNQHVQLLAV